MDELHAVDVKSVLPLYDVHELQVRLMDLRVMN
jgi:hypothetical protein